MLPKYGGTPVAALDHGAVREVVDDSIGHVFSDLDQWPMTPRVLDLNRHVRERAVARFGVAYGHEVLAVYQRIVGGRPHA